MKNKNTKNILNLSWIPYVVILFEMLYMASPFAVFFYGVYRLPLQFLASHKQTAWLIQTVFPHFSQSTSLMTNILLVISTPFMAVGLLVFAIAFIQIYYAKFTKKGAVTGGIYSLIRHPQYTSWTLFGLGMSIFWSRLIVWIMFTTMIFIYYFLARAEEKECLQKYPESYKPYYEKTGMFFPKLKFINIKMGNILPESNFKKILSITLIYFATCTFALFAGRAVRSHVIDSLSTAYGKDYFSLSLTVFDKSKVAEISRMIMKNEQIKSVLKNRSNKKNNENKMLIYIIPDEWGVSELGVETTDLNPMGNFRTHGNPKEKYPYIKKVLISEAVLYRPVEDNRDILHYAIRQKPLLMAKVNLKSGEITDITIGAIKSKYGDIPVPLF